jgi:tRNA(Ile)-lysidine synthase
VRKSLSDPTTALPLDLKLLKPGMRVAVGLSGGADSVALVSALAARSSELGLVLHVAHLHHGLRGAEADADLEFSRTLAAKLGLPFHEARVDTAAAAEASGRDLRDIESHPSRKNKNTARMGHPVSLGNTDYAAEGKPRESIEEAARRLRYAWFRRLMAEVPLDAVATAHTLDDQAETVLAKFLRGAWTEGLAGIAPRLETTKGLEPAHELETAEERETRGARPGWIVRPLLGVTRAEIEAYLRELGQEWRDDSSNRNLTFTRNRIRHELLPLLESWNPRLREHLSQMAELARDEEAWWRAEVERLAPQMILRGRPVRGGGRASGDSGVALDVTRLAALPPAMQRRLLRHAAKELGAAVDFEATEKLRAMALTGRAGQKLELAVGLRAERTPREVRLTLERSEAGWEAMGAAVPEYRGEIPGEIDAPAFGVRLELKPAGEVAGRQDGGVQNGTGPQSAILRNWRPGDRVRLRYSSGPRKVKEVLERMRVTGTGRALWPVLEVEGRIVWMKGVELEPEADLEIKASVTG